MSAIPFLILFLPLVAAAVIALFTQRDRDLSAKLSIGAVAISFVLSLGVLFFPTFFKSAALNWLSIGDLEIHGVKHDLPSGRLHVQLDRHLALERERVEVGLEGQTIGLGLDGGGKAEFIRVSHGRFSKGFRSGPIIG